MECVIDASPSPCASKRRLRAPQGDGATLMDPPLGASEQLIRDNQSQSSNRASILTQPVDEIAREARTELLAAAQTYTSSYLPTAAVDVSAPIVLSGHQPEWFHPGVWYKNFVLHRICHSCAATGIHLLIDNDLSTANGLQVPTGSVQSPRVEFVAMDRTTSVVPYEQRRIEDRSIMQTFGQRATDALAPLVQDPLLKQLWPQVLKNAEATDRLDLALSQARHQTEHGWGVSNLEVPFSQVCDGLAFHKFAAHILHDLPTFQSHYNGAIREYRSRHRLRSQSHPAPELDNRATAMETPFWIWSDSQPQRQRLFLQVHDGSDGRHWRLCGGLTDSRLTDLVEIPVTVPSELGETLQQHLIRRGWKLRPRALMTTMFARLFLSDLFLHGIGGAMYDEVTDAMIRSYFGATPPAYQCVSATLRLPVQRPHVDADDIRQVNGFLRELWYHPERASVDGSDCNGASTPFDQWTKEKKRLLADIPHGTKHAWHQQLEAVNQQLRTQVVDCRNQLIEERQRLTRQLRVDALLGSREYSFALFPEASFQAFSY